MLGTQWALLSLSCVREAPGRYGPSAPKPACYTLVRVDQPDRQKEGVTELKHVTHIVELTKRRSHNSKTFE